ncbi:MAG: hypothetical protein ACRCUT_15150, partial [Spirochaetota bacterium]
MKKIKIALLCITASLLPFLAGCSAPVDIDLSRGWEVYHINVESADFLGAGIVGNAEDEKCRTGVYNKDEWVSVPQLPASISDVKTKKKQLCWLRIEVVIPELMKGKDAALYLGKVWDTEKTYLNGVQIGKQGREYPDFHSDWNVAAYHYLPAELIRYGQPNVILVRQFSDQQLNFNGAPFIGEESKVRTYTFGMRFMAEYLPMAFGIMTLLVGIGMLIAFAFAKGQKNLLLFNFGGISILWFILTLHFWLPDVRPLTWRFHDNLFYIFTGFLLLWVYLALENILGIVVKWGRVVVGCAVLADIVIAVTATVQHPVTGWRFDLIGPLGVIAQILWGVLLVMGIRKGSAEAKILFGAYLIFFATLIHDALMMNRIIMSYAFLTNIAYPAFILSFGGIVFLRVAKLNKKLKISTAEIEEKNAAMQSVINSVIEATDELVSVGVVVKDAAESLNEQMQSQAASLEQSAAVLEQVSGSVESIANHAEKQDLTVKQGQAGLASYIEGL